MTNGNGNRRAFYRGRASWIPALGLLALAATAGAEPDIVVIVSANAEWKIVREERPRAAYATSPFGQWFTEDVRIGDRTKPVVFLHGGWGKVSAAASAQYAVDRWHPRLLVNLGTCGGFRGSVEKGDVILVRKTIIYDIVEQMGDADEAIRDYATDIDVSWTGAEHSKGVRPGLMLSADRDIVAADIPGLKKKYQAVAADWESGAIAYVAQRNKTPVLILRGVTDLVDSTGGEAYGNTGVFESGSRAVMKDLMQQLPAWLARFEGAKAAR